VKTLLLVCLIGSVTLTLAAQPVQLPPTPDGYHWERAKEIKAAFLMPDDWYFKHEKQGKTLAYFATRENIDRTGEFLVGLSVNVTPHLKGQSSAEYAKAFIASFPEGKKLLKTWDAGMGPFVGGGCLVEDETAVMHVFMVANPKTNTLYLFTFEAPKAEWESAWRNGEKMVRFLVLDDEI
jgi:hypothetical protein